jgi:NADPH-dependent glutamate synthase beta subunit-like oxidoreductase
MPRVLALAAADQLEQAYRLIKRSNPLPAICGRVCYHPCQGDCTRECLDSGISVQSIERYVAESCLELPEPNWAWLERGESAAVVGAGPAGLSAAYYLRQRGVQVHVFDAEEQPGGMLHVGIPSYRLPRPLLEKEIAGIASLGVEFRCGVEIGREITLEKLRNQYDAVLIATGAHRSRTLSLADPAGNGFISGLDLLREVNLGGTPAIGERVIVVGGGNTALDAARVVLRFGAEPLIVYRRSRSEMPATLEEIEEAESEGVGIEFLAAPKSVSRAASGRLRVSFVKMALGEPDESGRRRPVPIQDSEYDLEADSIIEAIGETADLSFLPAHMGDEPDIFFAGDAITGPSSVIQAIASGKESARAIMEFLGVESSTVVASSPSQAFSPEMLNAAYFPSLDGPEIPRLPSDSRTTNFAEIVQTLSPTEATQEASRCLSCGTCNQCDTCFVFCPEAAIARTPSGYTIDLTYCKGCGICAQECPRGVISLAEETS